MFVTVANGDGTINVEHTEYGAVLEGILEFDIAQCIAKLANSGYLSYSDDCNLCVSGVPSSTLLDELRALDGDDDEDDQDSSANDDGPAHDSDNEEENSELCPATKKK